MFKQALIAAAFGLLFAGNVLAVDNDHFAALAGAAQAEAAPTTTVSVTSEDTILASVGAFNVATSDEMVDAGLSIAGSLNQDGSFVTESSLLPRNVSVTRVPEPKDWLLMLAGVGLVGVMVERTKRRAI